MIKAIIFDMDGLLVDSEPYWDKARHDMAAEAGQNWTEDDHQAVMGVSTEEWTTYMIQRLKLTLSPPDVEQRIISRMVDLYQDSVPYKPGAVEAVQLAAAHYPIAVASGSPPVLIEAVTNAAELRGKFQAVLSADEVGPGKPDPAVYLAAARHLSVEPTACLCIEDSGNGILSGKRAGMTVIAVPDPRFAPPDELLEQADWVLNSMTEFSLSLIKNLEKT